MKVICRPGKTNILMTFIVVILSLFIIPSSPLHSADSINMPINNTDQQSVVVSDPSTTVLERSLWVGEKKSLAALDLNTGNKVLELSVEHVEDIAVDNSREVLWVGTRKEIIQYSFDGSMIFLHPLKKEKTDQECGLSMSADSEGNATGNHSKDHPRIRLSLDPSNGSLWYAGGCDVVKLAQDGKELFRIAMPQQVIDISVDVSDGSCWVGRKHHLSRYSGDGVLLLGFVIDSDNRVTSLAADPLAHALWIGTQKGLIKVDSIGQELFRTEEPRDIQDLEGNTVTGSLWLVSKKDVYKYRQDGQKLFLIPLCPRESNISTAGAVDGVSSQCSSETDGNHESCPGTLVTLAVDSLEDTCWVATKKTLFRLSNDGTVQMKIPGFHQIEAIDIGMAKLGITIIEPVEGAVFTIPSMTVRGTVSAPGGVVEVNGTPAVVNNFEFEASNIILSAGTNTITASVQNIAHQSAKDTVQVSYEPPVTGPSLLVCPEPYIEQQVHEPIGGCSQQVLIGRIHYNYGLVLGLVDYTVTSLIIDGINITPGYFYNSYGNRRMYGEWKGSLFWGVMYFVGSDGAYPVAVTAMDAQGKTISATVTFIKDMVPPKITITSPADGTVTNKQTIAINGVVDDPSAIVTDDQTGAIIPTMNGAFTYEFDMGPTEGIQWIFVRATDEALNRDFGGVAIIRDTIPPQISTILPAGGMYTNSQTIALAGTIADQNPGTVSVTVNSSLPQFLTVSGTSYSGTASLTNGSNILIFTATDLAGNNSVLSRTVIVDRDPPEVAIASPSPNSSLTGTAVFSATATDTLSGIQSVTILIDSKITGTLIQPPYDIFIDTFALTPGSHSITARAADKAGNQTETSVTVTIPHQFGVQITAPLSGTTINRTAAIIQGTITLPVGREIGVRVNGIPAEQQGTGFAAIVPLLQSQNTITATATNIYGIEEQAIITVNTDTAQEQVRLIVNPASGIMTVQAGGTTGFVTFMSIETYLTDTVESYVWDLNGDGSAEQSGDLLTQMTATYQIPGLYFPTVMVTDTMGNVYTESAIVNVLDRSAMGSLFRAKWEGMKTVLAAGDIESSLSYFLLPVRDKYRRMFTELGHQTLNSIFSSNYDLKLDTLSDREAECGALRLENGKSYSYPVMFIKDADGLWKIGVL